MTGRTAGDLIVPVSDVDQMRLPDVCARHGEPAAERADLVISAPWKRKHSRFYYLVFTWERAGEPARDRKLVTVPGWPLCARCLAIARARKRLAAALALTGLLLLVGAIAGRIAAGEPGAVLALPLLAGLLALPASLVVLVGASPSRLARASLSQDAAILQIADPTPAFVTQWRDRDPLAP